MKIAVDAMGGDFAPQEIVLGAIRAVNADSAMEVVLVGDQERIEAVLKEHGELGNPRLHVHHASEVIEMDEHPGVAIRKKKDASVVVATRLVKEKICDAIIAPGSTGAAVAAALFGLGRIKGIDRPVIATAMPTLTGSYTIMLDSGANANAKAKHLVQGAIMGYIYAQYLLGKQDPTVGLLNIGEEATKGNDLALETYSILETLKTIPFRGNVEGRDMLKGTVDVVVCDGFVGNVVLKFGEGLVSVLAQMLKETIKTSSWIAKIGAFFMIPVFKKLKMRLDYTEVGGAPLLGVNGVFLIAHGSSKSKEIMTAIKIAGEMVNRKIIDNIHKRLEDEGADKYEIVE